MGRPATVITLSEAEKAELLRRVKLRKGAQDARLRAEIILACAAGEPGNDIAQRLGTCCVTLAPTLLKIGIAGFER